MSVDPDQMIAGAGAELRRHYAPEITALKRRAAHRRRLYRIMAGMLATVIVTAASTLSFGWRSVAAPPAAPLSLILADGIRVDLDAGAAVDLPLVPWRHQARVLRGTVLFDIRHDDSRPFHVLSGDAQLTDLGTRFLVEHEPLSVAVYDGKVLVETAQGLAATVSPGHAVAIGHDAITPRPLPDESTTAWRDGLLVFRDTPLPEVAARLSRYRSQPVRIGDSTLNTLKVNGVFRIGDMDGALATLEQALPLQARHSQDATLLVVRSSRATAPTRR